MLFQADYHKLLKYGIYLGSQSFLTSAFSFLVNLILIRYIEPEYFGNYLFWLASFGLVLNFCSSKVNLYILKISSEEFYKFRNTIYFIIVFESILAAIILFLFSI